MTGPNLDKDIEHILVNVALNGAYEDAGQRVLSQGTIVKAKKYIDLLIANQVREARKDELAKLIFNDDEFATLEEIKNGKSVGGGMIQTELVEDRIKELGE